MVKIIPGTSNEKTVVFLHGYLLSSEIWFRMGLHLAPWRSVLLDLPYHGNHKNVDLESQNLNAYAEFVKNELLQAKIEKYILVGHSMGGYLGTLLLEMDENLEKLILLHSNIWEDSPERKKNRERVVQVVKRNKSAFLREAIPLLFKNKKKYQTQIDELIERASVIRPEGIIHGALSMRDRKESHEIVRKFKACCFFIQGSHDALIPHEEAKLVWDQAALSNNFFLIPNCGHMSLIERPRLLKKLLLKIVEIE